MNKTKSIIIMFLLSLMGVGTMSADEIITQDYSYTLHGTSGLGTLCFPTTVPFWTGDETKSLIGFRAFTVSGINNNVLTLSEISRDNTTDAIPENTPVILYWPYKAGETHTVIAIESEIYFTPQNIEATQTNLLGGTTSAAGETITGSATCNKYIMQDKGTTDAPKVAFYRCNGMDGTNYITYNVGQFRCWLDLTGVQNSGAKESSFSFSIPEESMPTSINQLSNFSPQLSDGIYSLNGTRVENPKHGEIYIIVMDGKAMKFSIK